MLFETQVAGIPCQCGVTHYLPGSNGSTWGRMEDAEEPLNEEFEFQLLDMNNKRALWLEEKVTDEIWSRLLDEYLATVTEVKHCFEGRLVTWH